MSDLPVTIAFTRTADPGHDTEVLAWIQAGIVVAESFPGFLGAGWLRPLAGSTEWHALVRFDSPATVDAWEGSPERQRWLRSGRRLAAMTRTERRTGIEGWFDTPATREVSSPAPPRWKQAIVIWSVFFPLNLLATVTLGRLLVDTNVILRVMITTLTLTPIMTYLLLPFATARLEGWLHARPRPSRRPG